MGKTKTFDGIKKAKLGTEKNPAAVHVQTREREEELTALCGTQGWVCTIEFKPDAPEDITDLDILMNMPKPRAVEEKTGRNESCPCGSGKKFKKCCGLHTA